jgi:hypothetical protein
MCVYNPGIQGKGNDMKRRVNITVDGDLHDLLKEGLAGRRSGDGHRVTYDDRGGFSDYLRSLMVQDVGELRGQELKDHLAEVVRKGKRFRI